MDLRDFGWDDDFAARFAALAQRGYLPGRIVKQLRDRSVLVSERGELQGEVSGRFRYQTAGRYDFPIVGDWAAIEPCGEGLAVIHAILPRRSAFSRKVPGELVEAQVVAANIDTVFLVSGLDGDFNLRRIERYLTTAWNSGASPVIVLNKADLRTDLRRVIAEVGLVATEVPVVAVSALPDGNLDALQPHLVPRKTIALLGSSGVGKSTLINRLLGEQRFRTAPMSDSEEGRGRHTTTARELVVLANGALLIDTPGMRELQLWSDEEGLDRTFDDLERLAAQCRFADCCHEQEPGCAVLAAVRAGSLDRRRLESYRKLRRELRFLGLKQDVATRRRMEKETGRRFAAQFKEIKRHKPSYK